MIKDLIVNLGLGDRDPAGEFAISIAEDYGAHVLGLYRRDLSTDTLRRRLRGETHAPDVPSTSAAR